MATKTHQSFEPSRRIMQIILDGQVHYAYFPNSQTNAIEWTQEPGKADAMRTADQRVVRSTYPSAVAVPVGDHWDNMRGRA